MYKREKNEKIIDELLKKMTLSEKIGQLHQVGPSPVGGFEISPDDAEKMLSAGKITKEKYDSIINHTMLDAREDEIRAGRIGSFIGIDDADTANHLQRIAVEESRMNEAIADLEEKDAIDATGEIYKDKRFLNILLIGTDEHTENFSENARGDSCMIMSIGKKDGSSKLASLERGMGVPILEGKYKGQYDWLTHTFRYGGADLMMREVRECFKVDIERYIRVNFATFKKGIDSVGGIDITLTAAEAAYVNGETKRKTYTAALRKFLCKK